MERWEGRVAVVCDFAGSRTGLAICKDLVNHGLTVIGLTKSEGMRDLEILKNSLSESRGKLIAMECNVRDEGHVNPVFRWIGENFDGIDLLINNMNSMQKGFILSDDNTSSLQKDMETNIMGLCLVSREGAKLMKQRPAERKNIGHIINITSTIGQFLDNCVPAARPVNGLYPACKHSAKAITECVRQELLYMDENVKITAISPGLVEDEDIHYEIGHEPALSAKDVSSAILYAISVKDHVQIDSIVIKPVGDFL